MHRIFNLLVGSEFGLDVQISQHALLRGQATVGAEDAAEERDGREQGEGFGC